MARIPLALISACCALAASAAMPHRATVYLDDSAAWEALRHEHPLRYEKILEVMRVAQAEPCETAPAVLKTRLHVNAKCQAFTLYTSYPAKTRLHFSVEDTDYAVFVVQGKLSGGKLIPAR